MKKFYFVFMLLLAATLSYSQEKFQPKEVFGNDAEKIWPGAEHIWLKQQNTVPSFVHFRNGSEPDEATFFVTLRKNFLLPSSYSFEQTGIETDQLGWQHKRFQLRVNNVPVSNGIFLLHIINGKVKKFNGYLFNNVDILTSASLSESSALALALKDVNATTYKWQLPEEEEFLKQESGDANATFYPKGELEILQLGDNTSGTFKTVWKFDIYAHEPMSREYIYVDAQSGEVLKRTTRIHHANTPGTATTVYRGNRPIVADSYNGAYRLYETTRGLGVRTRNMQRGTSYAGAVEFTDANNIWNNVNANLDQYAGDAHWGAEMTYDFYQTMGRNSINGNGYLLNLYMHYNVGYVNAFWDGTRMTFGDGNGTYDPLVPLDITGHEIAHGLDEYTANLDYSYESGALNESFSDIFGAAVEWYADSTQADWTMAEDIGPIFRSMSSPNTYGDPDTYLGTNWYAGTADYGGVHTNSGVQNHWYYRLVQGGSGTNDIGNAFNVTGIGRTKATAIAWRNMVNYLTNSSDYADARFYAIQSANDLYGACSQEVVSTTKAWYAVGVGPDYSAGADAQFSASPLIGCTIPFTVTFSNTSSNANSYIWYFGDGTTSSATSPSHTYTASGLYSVKLVAIGGGTCGSDSVVYSNLINVSTSNACEVILPATGTYQLQTACYGTVYDNGGPSGNYTNNTSSVVTIAPPGAAQVRLHFTQFNMEVDYDYLYVYDGPTTASPVIGSYTGTTIPPDIISSGSSITIRQYSDPLEVGSGFAIQWNCINPTSPPVSNFVADATQSCTGAIKFTDLTTGGANSWLWNFGDGGTSTLQHPVHTYLTNGSFTVSLTTSNSFGNHTATKNNYITITKPAGPVVPVASSCGPQSFTLSTGDTDPATWFDVSGNVVSYTSPFITPLLNATTTYYVQDTVSQPVYNVGPVSNTVVSSTGGNFNNNATLGLKFNVFKKSILESVLVYASGDGYRTIQYRDSIGGIISQKSVFIPNGASRVTLNIDLIPGGPYLLRLKDTTNLYRNTRTTCCTFPFSDAGGILTITGNNATTAPYNYYYFYDWEVKEHDCISLRTPVTVSVNPVVTASISSTNVSCFGGSNGAISVTPAGGVPGYNYNWGSGITSQNLNALPPGTYSVTVSDANSCSTVSSATISEPTPINISVNTVHPTCNQPNGSISLTVSGGALGYTYLWAQGQTTPSISNVGAGNYSFTVTDNNACSVISSAVINSPAVFVPHVTADDVSCFGINDGSAEISVTNGTLPISYSWSNGALTSSITNLPAGSYTATITDGSGCSTVISQTISEPAALNIAITSTDVLCNQNNGSAVSNISGGTAGYTYLWSSGETTHSIAGLTPGNYVLTVTDSNSCTAASSTTISNISALETNTTSADATCFGISNGSAGVTVISGTQPYSYVWSNGGNSSSIDSLVAGEYFVTVTDGNNCQQIDTAVITEPDVLAATITSGSISCFGGTDGNAIVTVSGGTPVYSYLWCTGNITATATNLNAGDCSVTITDANGCSINRTVSVTEPAEIQFTTNVVDASAGMNNGSASVAVSGGTSPYAIDWSDGGDGTNLAAGTYSFSITDANGCIKTGNVMVDAVTGVGTIKEEFSFMVYPNPASEELFIVVSELKDKTSVSLKNVLGQSLLSQTISSATTTINLSNYAAGIYALELKQGQTKSVKEIVISR